MFSISSETLKSIRSLFYYIKNIERSFWHRWLLRWTISAGGGEETTLSLVVRGRRTRRRNRRECGEQIDGEKERGEEGEQTAIVSMKGRKEERKEA